MVYNPAADFVGLWRNNAGQVSKSEMPGLDFLVAALARAGVINLVVAAAPPVVSQSVTAWLRTAVPSYSAEGALFLWDAVSAAYVAATPALFLSMLQAVAGQNGVSWRTTEGGPPLNTVGNDGDFAIQTDEPGGIYGPKAAGVWPADPIPGTTDIIGSRQLDLSFGATEGLMIYRGSVAWQSLPIGDEEMLLSVRAGIPQWRMLTSLFDDILGGVQGDIIYRGVDTWQILAPGAATQVLTTGGPGANPAWAARTAEFPSGTVMLFQQSAAPPGWTKQTAVNDYGLRVTSGAVGVTAGAAFSTVFAQTAVGNTTLTVTTMPSHNHTVNGAAVTTQAVAAVGHAFADAAFQSTGSAGGDGAHAHSVNLALAYVDVIIASKN